MDERAAVRAAAVQPRDCFAAAETKLVHLSHVSTDITVCGCVK